MLLLSDHLNAPTTVSKIEKQIQKIEAQNKRYDKRPAVEKIKIRSQLSQLLKYWKPPIEEV